MGGWGIDAKRTLCKNDSRTRSRGKGVDDNLADCTKELQLVDKDCEVGRDERRAGVQIPLLNNDEWGRLQDSTTMRWEEWLGYKPYMGWTYLARALYVQGAVAWGSTVSRTDNAMSRLQEPVQILEMEVLPI